MANMNENCPPELHQFVDMLANLNPAQKRAARYFFLEQAAFGSAQQMAHLLDMLNDEETENCHGGHVICVDKVDVDESSFEGEPTVRIRTEYQFKWETHFEQRERLNELWGLQKTMMGGHPALDELDSSEAQEEELLRS